MIGACLWVVKAPVTKTKKTERKVKFPHTSIVFTLDPNSNKNNDADDDDDDDDDDDIRVEILLFMQFSKCLPRTLTYVEDTIIPC